MRKFFPATEIIFPLINLENKIKGADLIISGEGKIDAQTLNGKLLAKVSDLVKKQNKRLWAICGYFAGDKNLQKQLGIEKVFSLAKSGKEVPEAIKNAKERMMKLINDIERLVKSL